MSETTLFKSGSVLAIVGAVLGLVANVLHPRTSETGAAAAAELIARSDIWVGDHVGILVAVLFATAGLLAVYRSLSGERAVAFARLGAGAALVGASLWSVLIGVDGIAAKRLADAWAAAPSADKAVALHTYDAVATAGSGIVAVAIAVLFGATFILYGLAVAYGEEYPRWLGWAAVVLGVAATLVGLDLAYRGPSQLVQNVIFPIVSILQTFWILVIGVLLWRRATPALARAPAMA